ncbi:MAG: VOC family protein [Pseudomonadales bacterium]|nr:VOC family protein [Pseudomonadales bacterium]MDP7357803.1 VOC family protein [Pseudomonadales bacterium]MDP7596810.1 VOC family protein [Pseudomonadales bacterium]HJN51188.1 VOC family protein [Pseudomonadales bacterium]
MSHKSRVCAVLFDVDSSSYEKAAQFWAGALGRDLKFDANEKYTSLQGELDYLIQNAADGREGVHIDIETDDVDAEVERLVKLGAKKREKVKGWWVMISPGGHPFCIVPVQSKTWPKGAIEWD